MSNVFNVFPTPVKKNFREQLKNLFIFQQSHTFLFEKNSNYSVYLYKIRNGTSLSEKWNIEFALMVQLQFI